MHIKSLWLLLLVLLGGYGYGIVGKKTTGAVNTLDNNVMRSLAHLQDTALGTGNGQKRTS